MAEELDLLRDLFDAVMLSREVSKKYGTQINRFIESDYPTSTINGLPIIVGKAYKLVEYGRSQVC